MKNKEKFDAVKMMHEIRDKHHKEYELNPELREQRLEEIRVKYSHKISNKGKIKDNPPAP